MESQSTGVNFPVTNPEEPATADEQLLRALRVPMEMLTDGMRMIQFVSKAREAASVIEDGDARIRELESELGQARELLIRLYEGWQAGQDPGPLMHEVRAHLKRVDASRDPLDLDH